MASERLSRRGFLLRGAAAGGAALLGGCDQLSQSPSFRDMLYSAEGVTERVLDDAQTARDEGDDEWADALEVIAETAVPSEDILDRVHTYKRLDEEEEREWNDLYNVVVQGG